MVTSLDELIFIVILIIVITVTMNKFIGYSTELISHTVK